MTDSDVRPMRRSDWIPVTTSLNGPDGTPFRGYARADGQGGNPLFQAQPNDTIETQLTAAYAVLRARYPAVTITRHHARMPYWHGNRVPAPADYRIMDSPTAFTSTAITVILAPNTQLHSAALGYHFQDSTLPPLRERMQHVRFQGLVGNLGYYMTADLISTKFPWAHNLRYPAFPLPEIPSYIGFHWHKDRDTGGVWSAFESAHPSAVAIRAGGDVEIIHSLNIKAYTARFGSHTVHIDAINTPDAAGADVVVFTPALKSPEVERHIALYESAGGASDVWQTYTPMIPLADGDERIHVFVANESRGTVPQEQVVAVWQGSAPLPSFGAVLSFKRAYFEATFGTVDVFEAEHLNHPVQIIPVGGLDFDRYQHIMGGFVPAVIDGRHLYAVDTVTQALRNLGQFGNATSPIAQTGRETRNFDPHRREPAGLLIQTQHHTGWVLFDGRHELSIGASVIDAALLLRTLETAGHLAGESVQQAIFIDGGSAMKVYDVVSDGMQVILEPLNRVAAGARNGPSPDHEGLNLYSTLALALAPPPDGYTSDR